VERFNFELVGGPMFKIKLLFILLLAGIFSTGCATVHQIDRENLSRRIMQLEPEPNQQVFINDFHAIREGASGGTSQSAGGGCGCN
jgi:hypothetical protein